MKEAPWQSLVSQGSVSGRGSTLYITRDLDGVSDETHVHISQKSSHLRQPIQDDRDDTSSVGCMPYLQSLASILMNKIRDSIFHNC